MISKLKEIVTRVKNCKHSNKIIFATAVLYSIIAVSRMMLGIEFESDWLNKIALYALLTFSFVWPWFINRTTNFILLIVIVLSQCFLSNYSIVIFIADLLVVDIYYRRLKMKLYQVVSITSIVLWFAVMIFFDCLFKDFISTEYIWSKDIIRNEKKLVLVEKDAGATGGGYVLILEERVWQVFKSFKTLWVGRWSDEPKVEIVNANKVKINDKFYEI